MVRAPCAGSGSLLLKFAKIVGVENVGSFYGQEINLTIYNLCRINMFLRDVNFSNFDIARGVTLSAPAHWHAQLFDAIVSNPPYSMKWEGRTIQRSYLIRVCSRWETCTSLESGPGLHWRGLVFSDRLF